MPFDQLSKDIQYVLVCEDLLRAHGGILFAPARFKLLYSLSYRFLSQPWRLYNTDGTTIKAVVK